MTLSRPVGEAELALIARSHYRRFPPRLSGQPFFYPVCTREYAEQIARDWNARQGDAGYVTRFDVSSDFLLPYRIHVVGSGIHSEYWIPAEALPDFNDAIVGPIEVVSRFGRGSGTFAMTLDPQRKRTGEDP